MSALEHSVKKTVMSVETLKSSTPQISLDSIRQPVGRDLEATDALIQEYLFSEVPLIQDIVQHILQSGGKRIRPLLVLLISRALNYSGAEHIELATVIEFIHTATLLHDDVVDESLLRRGRKTANALWDNQATVLTGDFLYSRAFQLLAKRSNVPITQLLAQTTNAIAEGELWQLMNRGDTQLSEQHYFKVIHYKTAQLFAAAAAAGCRVATEDKQLHDSAYRYGEYLGLAFQLIDDLLDYTADTQEMGKNSGDDLADGKMTLPLIYALQHTDEPTNSLIKKAIQQQDVDQLSLIKEIIKDTGAIQYTQQHALHYAQLANAELTSFPPSEACTALHKLTNFVVQRHF